MDGASSTTRKEPGDPAFVKSEGSEAQPLYVAPVPKHAHFQIWSPDGSFIYFVQGYPPNEMDIWRIRPTGGAPERITFHNSRVSYPTFLDCSTLLYLATDADGSGPWIYGLDVEQRVPHRLSSGVERWTSLAGSGDGRRLVATATQIRPSLWRVPLSARPAEASDAHRIPLPTAQGRAPVLATNYLLYVSSDGATERIWKLVDGTATDLWTAPVARIIGGPAIAPEGDRIAFSIADGDKTRLVVMNADGTGVRTVNDSLPLRGAPAWSPDGRSIVTAANQGGSPRLFRISLETREPVRILDEYALDPAWAPRAEFLVYSGMDPGNDVPGEGGHCRRRTVFDSGVDAEPRRRTGGHPGRCQAASISARTGGAGRLAWRHPAQEPLGQGSHDRKLAAAHQFRSRCRD